MNTGTVKFFNEGKHFGFVKDTNSSKEYYFHASSVSGRVAENDQVTFDTEEGRKGLCAVNVKKV